MLWGDVGALAPLLGNQTPIPPADRLPYSPVDFKTAGTDLTLDAQNEERDGRAGQDDSSRAARDPGSAHDSVSTVLRGTGTVLLGLACRIATRGRRPSMRSGG